jgi:hypothetical protein
MYNNSVIVLFKLHCGGQNISRVDKTHMQEPLHNDQKYMTASWENNKTEDAMPDILFQAQNPSYVLVILGWFSTCIYWGGRFL